jgi:hypothetical protein
MDFAQLNAQLGYLFADSIVSIVLPMGVVVVCNYIPAAKGNPKIVYSICGAIAVAMAFTGGLGGNSIGLGGYRVLTAAIAAILAALFFFWGYKQAARKIAPPVST